MHADCSFNVDMFQPMNYLSLQHKDDSNHPLRVKYINLNLNWTSCNLNPLLPSFASKQFVFQKNSGVVTLMTETDISAAIGTHSDPQCNYLGWFLSGINSTV